MLFKSKTIKKSAENADQFDWDINTPNMFHEQGAREVKRPAYKHMLKAQNQLYSRDISFLCNSRSSGSNKPLTYFSCNQMRGYAKEIEKKCLTVQKFNRDDSPAAVVLLGRAQ